MLACAAICVVLLIVKPENTWPGLILTLAGIPVYFFWKLRGKHDRSDKNDLAGSQYST